VAEVLAGVPPKLPNKGFEAGVVVEAEVVVAVVVVAFEREGNKLEAAGAAEDVADGINELVAGAVLAAEAWVPGVLPADGKLKVDFGASEAGAVVDVVVALELAGVEEGLLKRALGVEVVALLFRFENSDVGFGWVESVGFAPPKRGC
jgi:hypothetical protein